MYFKFKKNGTDVVFNAPSPSGEMMDNFTGSPSAYFAFAVPQEGITKPADFNASVSGYLKKIWNGTATGTGAGTLSTTTDANGYYTLVLTGVRIPAEASMVTGGLGYTYSLSSAPPLIQTNLADYPVTIDAGTGKPQGGLSVPAPNVWKVAAITGNTGRRTIVDNAKCKNCHGTLGVEPSFHAGQRNDGPTCSFCHTPNRNSSGWQAGSKYFIHAIHAGRKRVESYTWHAAEAGPGYDEVEFPGTLNTCTTCHAAGAYDFTNAANFSALANTTLVTVASGVVNDTSTNSTYYTISPYVAQGVSTDYGAGFAYNAAPTAANNGYTDPASSTLVNSPITNVCASCHDTGIAITHMRQNGGFFYETRLNATAANAPKEQCIICHGPGRIAAIGSVHQR
jgi:OmcA/MtrC family decaheme c-type cytochrome